MQVIFTIPACKTMECLVKEWSMGAFSENQIPLGMVRVVNVERVLKKAAYRGNGQVILGITNSVYHKITAVTGFVLPTEH